jgi:hypothetical protein
LSQKFSELNQAYLSINTPGDGWSRIQY